jgi:hypothetical protein
LFESGSLDIPALYASEKPTRVIVDVISTLPLSYLMLFIYGLGVHTTVLDSPSKVTGLVFLTNLVNISHLFSTLDTT